MASSVTVATRAIPATTANRASSATAATRASSATQATRASSVTVATRAISAMHHSNQGHLINCINQGQLSHRSNHVYIMHCNNQGHLSHHSKQGQLSHRSNQSHLSHSSIQGHLSHRNKQGLFSHHRKQGHLSHRHKQGLFSHCSNMLRSSPAQSQPSTSNDALSPWPRGSSVLSKMSCSVITSKFFQPRQLAPRCSSSCPAPGQVGEFVYLTLPKCRLLCEVDYDSMPSFSIFRCLFTFSNCHFSLV